MKKKCVFTLILSALLIAATTAGAANIDGFIASEHRYFEAPFTWGPQYFMLASAYTDDTSYTVRAENIPGVGDNPMNYIPGWDYSGSMRTASG